MRGETVSKDELTLGQREQRLRYLSNLAEKRGKQELIEDIAGIDLMDPRFDEKSSALWAAMGGGE
jgi:hypothetical protein